MQTTDLVVSLQCTEKLWNIKAPAKPFVILTAQCMCWLEHFISLCWMSYFMQIQYKLWSLFVNNEIKIKNRKPSNRSWLFITCWAELFPYAYFLHCSQPNRKILDWYGAIKVFFQKNLNVKKEVTTKKKNGNDLLNAWSLLRGKITIRFNLFVQS